MLRKEAASARREQSMTSDHRKMNYDAYWVRVNEVLKARDEAKAGCEEIGRQYWESPRPDPFAAALRIRLGRHPGVRPVSAAGKREEE